MKRLPDAELEVMKVLWELGPDTSRSEVEGGLAAFGWAANTVNTYLSRLADKGFVSVRREGKTNLYTPWSVGRTTCPLTAGWCWTGCTAAPKTLWPPWPGMDWSGVSWRNSRPCWRS